MGAGRFKYKYSIKEIYNIKKSDYFWKFIDFFACKIARFGNLYEKSISNEYEAESKKFDIRKSKNIIHIGCGAYPISAITLAKMNGGRVVAIDRNIKAVEYASKIIKKRNLEEIITVKKGDGRFFPIEKFDTIIVSSCSVPKVEVLENIFSNAKNNCKIIVREQYAVCKAVESMIEKYENIDLVERKSNSSFPNYRWESYHLIKK